MTNPTTGAAGIDIAKHTLDFAIHGQPGHLTVENRRPGWRRLAAELSKAGVGRVGLEATGGYERGVVAYLRAAGFTVLVLQPLQVKAYARLHLRRAKNDALDAALIAACTATIEASPDPPDARLAPLADALTFVEQIEEELVRHHTRLEHIQQGRFRRMVLADIRRLEARRRAELRRIVQALRLPRRSPPPPGSPPKRSRHRRTHGACFGSAPARTRAAQPRAGRRPGRPGAVRRRHRPAPGRTPYRRRPQAAAPFALCRRPAGGVPVEPGLHRPLQATDRKRKVPQGRTRRLRQKAAHLRQRRRLARLALAATSRMITLSSKPQQSYSPAGNIGDTWCSEE